MDLIHKLLNIVAPPVTFISLALFLPPYWAFKLFLSTINSIFIGSENVAGKVVHITGASSGIGEYLAYEYGRRGARLALSARRETALREVADRARHFGSPDVIIMRADVSKVEDCRRLVDQTVEHFGRLDHLVNNAAIGVCTLFEELTDITNLKPVMASKAALVSVYETLRVEVGSEIGITIVTPGYIESELTKGKFLLAPEGKMGVDQDMRDVEVSAMPVGSVSGCAKSIVNSTLRGDRYLTVPGWFRMSYVIKVLCPEIMEWTFRMLYLNNNPAREAAAPSKKILDVTGVKNLFYPSSIRNPEVKTE